MLAYSKLVFSARVRHTEMLYKNKERDSKE